MRPLGRDAQAVLDVELGLAEGRRDLVLHDLDPHAVADRLRALLERLDPPDVEPLRGVELERAPAGLGLRGAEHDADLLPDLVREQAEGVGAVEVAGQLAHGLAHHPGLEADGLIAHLTLQLGARREGGHGVDGHDVDRARADEQVGDLERLLAVVGLGDEQLVDVDPDALGVHGVHRVLRVDERADAPQLLGLGEHVVDEGGLARGLGAEDLDDPPTGQAAHPEREVERQRAGGDRRDLDGRRLVPHPHDRPAAELALDLRERAAERRLPGLRRLLLFLVHVGSLSSRSEGPHATGETGRTHRPWMTNE